jgi:hypothetical protein
LSGSLDARGEPGVKQAINPDTLRVLQEYDQPYQPPAGSTAPPSDVSATQSAKRLRAA